MKSTNMNSIYVPKSTLEYFRNEFKEEFEIINLNNSEDTVKITFNRNLNEIDITNIFFTGAKWAINYNLENK